MRTKQPDNRTRARVPSPSLDRSPLVAVAMAWACYFALDAHGEEPKAPDTPALPRAVLHLNDGGFVPGELKDSARPGTLRWLGAPFAEPFEFLLGGVDAIQFPLPAALPRPAGDYCVELEGGDVVFGALVDIDEREAVLETPRLGRLRLPRTLVGRIDRWRDRDEQQLYVEPSVLGDWGAATPQGSWRQESGRLSTDQEGASLTGGFAIPARASVEFEVAWVKKPDFVLALGASREKPSLHAARFEVWGDDLVALLETEDALELASVAKVSPGPGRVHLRADLDQERGRLVVISADGETLADLKLNVPHPRVLDGVTIANVRGDLRLERLRIGRWDGESPPPAVAERPRIRQIDGSVVSGRVERFDATSREFIVRGEPGENRVAEDRVASVYLSPAGDDPPREVRVITLDAARLSGDLSRVEEDKLWLKLPGSEEVIRLPIDQIRSLIVLRHGSPTDKRASDGVLEMEGVRLPGHLVDGRSGDGSSCLAWQPRGSATAGRLRGDASGRILFKEPTPTTPKQQGADGRAVVRQGFAPAGMVIINGGIVQRMQRPASVPASQPPRTRPSLHLRSGDVIPAEVTGIDVDGVRFRTPISQSTFVAHDKVKAVEMAADESDPIRLNKSKRERLLTLPRMQKDSPPTHLIHARNGDYLRGRVVSLDDATLRVEVRLETRDVPRDRIGQIVWLHADELDASKGPAVPAGGERGLPVLALRSDGDRLSFFAEELADATLYGKSDVLGDCRVRLGEVDQLVFGAAIGKAAAQMVFQRWKLQNAPEPKVAQDDAGGTPGRLPGTESALVGKPAPDFELDLMGGGKFRVSSGKGRILLLDFWATWCGPCIQAMPQVERIAEEFRDRGVQLVAVNLQEAPERIAAMLERYKLRPAVALDRDGAVAEKYGANAIPQTVIIDREGNVVRLFVGGGPHLGDQLRDALNAVLAAGKSD